MGATMLETVHKRAARQLCETDKGAAALADLRRGMEDGVYGKDRAYLHQFPGAMNDGQLHAFGQVWSLIQRGLITTYTIPLLGDLTRAQKDRQWQSNAEALSHLPDGFTAEVYPATSGNDCDGRLRWNIGHMHPFGDLDSTIPAPYGIASASGDTSAPLEIGLTKASVSWWHLLRDGALARWPYHRGEIMLFVADRAVNEQYGPCALAVRLDQLSR